GSIISSPHIRRRATSSRDCPSRQQSIPNSSSLLGSLFGTKRGNPPTPPTRHSSLTPRTLPTCTTRPARACTPTTLSFATCRILLRTTTTITITLQRTFNTRPTSTTPRPGPRPLTATRTVPTATGRIPRTPPTPSMHLTTTVSLQPLLRRPAAPSPNTAASALWFEHIHKLSPLGNGTVLAG
ncbi:hypothetical protein M9458_023499, partial [Cirrhinus mrigala]